MLYEDIEEKAGLFFEHTHDTSAFIQAQGTRIQEHLLMQTKRRRRTREKQKAAGKQKLTELKQL